MVVHSKKMQARFLQVTGRMTKARLEKVPRGLRGFVLGAVYAKATMHHQNLDPSNWTHRLQGWQLAHVVAKLGHRLFSDPFLVEARDNLLDAGNAVAFVAMMQHPRFLVEGMTLAGTNGSVKRLLKALRGTELSMAQIHQITDHFVFGVETRWMQRVGYGSAIFLFDNAGAWGRHQHFSFFMDFFIDWIPYAEFKRRDKLKALVVRSATEHPNPADFEKLVSCVRVAKLVGFDPEKIMEKWTTGAIWEPPQF